MLLRHSAKLEQDAQAVETSVRKVLEQGYRTADLARGESKMTVSTQEMGKYVHQALKENIDAVRPCTRSRTSRPGNGAFGGARRTAIAPSAQRDCEKQE